MTEPQQPKPHVTNPSIDAPTQRTCLGLANSFEAQLKRMDDALDKLRTYLTVLSTRQGAELSAVQTSLQQLEAVQIGDLLNGVNRFRRSIHQAQAEESELDALNELKKHVGTWSQSHHALISTLNGLTAEITEKSPQFSKEQRAFLNQNTNALNEACETLNSAHLGMHNALVGTIATLIENITRDLTKLAQKGKSSPER